MANGRIERQPVDYEICEGFNWQFVSGLALVLAAFGAVTVIIYGVARAIDKGF